MLNYVQKTSKYPHWQHSGVCVHLSNVFFLQFDENDEDDDLHTSPHTERGQQSESHDCTNM